MTTVEGAITAACSELAKWLGGLPKWEHSPWVEDSRGYRGPTILGEADCRLHLVRYLSRHLEPEWLHQEVPTSAYLFPQAEVSRRSCIDIGIVDPERLAPSLTADDMPSVRWNALIEVKFRGNSPGWEFAAASESGIREDLKKLTALRPYCDQALVIVVEELDPLSEYQVEELGAAETGVDLRFVTAS